MDTPVILPVLDTEALQKKANEYAMKGAEEALKEFYMGYNSPYRKAINDNLLNKGTGHSFEIPDIIGVLNDEISKEIDIIANTAISKTFLPLVKEFLTRADAELKLSDILTEFIDCTGFKYDDDLQQEDYTLDIKKEDGSFTYIILSNGKQKYEIHFFIDSENKKKEKKTAYIYRLPEALDKNGYANSYTKTMKVTLDGVTLEMPFTPNVLSDKFTKYISRLVMCKSNIIFDVDDFNEDMFPENECHC